jgi:aspartate racemase
MTTTKTVGVIGGLGPAATLDFFARVINKTKALNDQSHLRLIIDNNTKIADRNMAMRGDGPSPGPMLAATARGLEIAGADFVVMACNTAHAWESEIRAALSIPFVSMVEETMKALLRLSPAPARVGLLAVDAARGARLYQDALEANDIAPLLLDEQDQREFMSLIYAIKSGDVSPALRERMRALANRLAASGADAVIAGCTEIPLVLDRRDVAVPLVDSTDSLVTATILLAGAELKESRA